MGKLVAVVAGLFGLAAAITETPNPQTTSYIEESISDIRQQLKEHGYAVASAVDDDVLGAMENAFNFLGQTFYYTGGFFSRLSYGDGIYDVGASNASQEIPHHNEMGSSPRVPRYIIFGCVHPGTSGGDTSLSDGHKVFESLTLEEQQQLVTRKVRTSLRWDDDTIDPNTTSWRSSLGVADPAEAESAAKSVGYHYTWQGPNREVFAAFDYAPVLTNPASGKHVLVEQIVTSHGATLYNEAPKEEALPWIDRLHHSWWASNASHLYDKSHDIDLKLVDKLRQLEEDVAVKIPGRVGQIVVVDNIWMKHARTPYTGPRKIMVRMMGAHRGSLGWSPAKAATCLNGK